MWTMSFSVFEGVGERNAEARRGAAQSQFCRTSRWARADRTFLRVDLENNAEARLAAHHTVVSGLASSSGKISFIEAIWFS